MEASTGVGLFSTDVSAGAAAHFDIDGFWRRVTAVEHPGPAPALDVPDAKFRVRASAGAVQFKQKRALQRFYALILSAAPLPFVLFVSVPLAGRLLFLAAAVGLYYVARQLVRAANDTREFADRARSDLGLLDKIREEWQSTAGPARFEAKRAELEELRARWADSGDLQKRKQREREDRDRSAALNRYLDRFDIEEGRIPDLSPSRIPLLESFGVHTAADVVPEKLAAVPRLEKATRDVLVAWRQTLEARFRQEGGSGPASLDEQLVEREAAAERMRIEAALRSGLQDLQEIQKQALFARVSMKSKVEDLHRAYMQSAADLKAVR